MTREGQPPNGEEPEPPVRCATADAHPDGTPTDASGTWARPRGASGGTAMQDAGIEYAAASRGSWMTMRLPSVSCRVTTVSHPS